MKLKQSPLLVAMLVLALVLSACAGSAPAGETSTGAGAASVAAASQAAVNSAPLAASTAASTATASTAASVAASEAASTAASASAAAGGTGQASAAASTAAAASGSAAPVTPASAGEYLQTIRNRGRLVCGFHGGFAGFGTLDQSGNAVGFDVDICKAVAAAIFGDATKIEFRPLPSAATRFTAVQTREIDILSRNTTWTISRDTSVGMDFAPTTFYDGQGMMVRTAENLTRLEDMGGATICVQSGTTTELNLTDAFRALNLEISPVVFDTQDAATSAYAEGRCDGLTTDKSQLASIRVGLPNPDEHVIMDVTMSKEPLTPAVLQGDPQWHDLVAWVVYGLITAEELGITQENVDTFSASQDPNVRRFLGLEGELGQGLGVENNFMVNVIKGVGNYGEIYNRHLGPETPFNLPRGQNALYRDGGLLYAPPFR